MSKTRSEKSNFPSRYSPQGWVSPAQYLVELVCENKARAEGKDLPVQFWEIKEWATYYRGQMPAAHKLLKLYDVNLILDTLKTFKGKKVHSLRAKWFIELIDEQAKLRQSSTRNTKIEDEMLTESIEDKQLVWNRPKQNKGIKSKLEELDG